MEEERWEAEAERAVRCESLTRFPELRRQDVMVVIAARL